MHTSISTLKKGFQNVFNSYGIAEIVIKAKQCVNNCTWENKKRETEHKIRSQFKLPSILNWNLNSPQGLRVSIKLNQPTY